MTKVVLDKNSTSVNPLVLNENFRKIEKAFNEDVLFRKQSGSTPNSVEANLDMNNHRLYNLPPPGSSSEPIRLKELSEVKSELSVKIEEGIVEATTNYLVYYNLAKG